MARTRYDAMGRAARSWGPFFSTFTGYHSENDIPENVPYVKTEYDLRSRPIRIESPLGADVDSTPVAETTFSYSGLSVTVEDPDGGKKTETKDYLGRVVQVTEYSDAGELYTHYEYNAAGDLLRVTNALGKDTTISYDSLGRKTGMIDPDMGAWRYTYDANGNLITQTDANGATITFVYDELNRMTDKTYSTLLEIDPPVQYTYDEASVPNGVGRLHKVENANASTTIDAYSEMGLELTVTRSIAGAPAPSYTTTYSYDLSGKLESMTYPGGYQVNYAYHPGSGLLHTVTGITDLTEYAELSGYEPTGKIGNIYHGNGAETLYTYDTRSTRLLSINTTDPHLADIQNRVYKYTPAGDIKTISRASGGQSISHNYSYDKLHRLISETNTGGADDFDPSLLIKTFDDAAPIHAVKSVNFNGSDYPYTYDSNGNMIQSWDFSDTAQPLRRKIDYNADNMPYQITQFMDNDTVSVSVDFSYDGEGVRVKKTVGAGTTYYIGDHFEVAAGVEIKYIFAGSLRIAKATTTEKQFYHKNHLGSTIAITNYFDGSGAETAEYLPFGLYRKHSETEVTYYKFSDQEHDAEVGLYDFNARLYDPAIGIFISPDSIVPDPYDPQTLNRYAYCRNNPLIYADPSGHIFHIVAGAAIGAIIGGGISAATGGDIGMGMLTGAIGGAFFGAAGTLINAPGAAFTAGQQAFIHAGAGVMSVGINAGITGGDPGIGMLTGGLAGGLGKLASPLFSSFPEQLLGRSLIGGVVGGIGAELYGGSFAAGFKYGAFTGAVGYLCNETALFTTGLILTGVGNAVGTIPHPYTLLAGRALQVVGAGLVLASKLSDPNPVPVDVREEYENIRLGRGTPRRNSDGSQRIYRAHELKQTQKSSNVWAGSREYDVPGTNHRILQAPNGKYGYVLNHNYRVIKPFPSPWYP